MSGSTPTGTRNSSTTRACATPCSSPSITTASAGGTRRTPTRNSMQLGPKRDVVARACRRRAREGSRLRLLLLAARLGARGVSRSGGLRRRVHAAADPRAHRPLRPRGVVGRRALGPPGCALARRADRRRRARRRLRRVLFNDRFFAPNPDFVTFEYDVPDTPPDVPWELCRGLSHSFCVNRAERDEDHLDARGIVALLVETVAKGGNLLLNVGPNADGTLAAIQERVLRESGAWVRAHADAIHGSTRFDEPGNGAQWYTRTGDDRARVRPVIGRGAALRGVARRDASRDARRRRADVSRDRRRHRRRRPRRATRDPLGTRYVVSCDTARPIRARTVAKNRDRRVAGGGATRATSSTCPPAATPTSSSRSRFPRASRCEARARRRSSSTRAAGTASCSPARARPSKGSRSRVARPAT